MRVTLITCDCCKKEIEEQDIFNLDVHVHILNRTAGHVKLVDGKHHTISGRKERLDFCIPCYNHLMYKMMDEIKTLEK